ncbi:class A beta-lactamase [Altererythrobacter xixiisoli]|uniref:Beta-lactamase n=1 Tax=Croceibacterium xixiisoli TaxID=1476466 RepID=A0A6I4TTE5_9SPHN|nr:class A beta-lactamase [Croceibacterium xixiisoli]MXO99445.1 class A beta-lactamase [Croceibacterium xixiisoli]
MFDRRSLLAGAVAALAMGCTQGEGAAPDKTDDRAPFDSTGAVDALAELERQADGRLGAFIVDPARGQGFGWREDERFSMCSTFKLSLAAMVLAMADHGELDPLHTLYWSKSDLVPHSPATEPALADGMTALDLARATLVLSDNTAANVLLREYGGPAAMTRFWRAMGDDVSRLDRFETELNDTPPNTDYDTSTPAAMARTVSRLLLGAVLSPTARATLRQWMMAIETGLDRIRAGFPAGWIAGDKTGTGFGATRHTYGDLAFGGPSGATPLIIAAWFEPSARIEPRDPGAIATLARVGQIAAATRGTPPQALLIRHNSLF